MRNYDELALCPDCLEETERAERAAMAQSEQAGAQFVGMMRETRDDRRVQSK